MVSGFRTDPARRTPLGLGSHTVGVMRENIATPYGGLAVCRIEKVGSTMHGVWDESLRTNFFRDRDQWDRLPVIPLYI